MLADQQNTTDVKVRDESVDRVKEFRRLESPITEDRNGSTKKVKRREWLWQNKRSREKKEID